MIRVSYDAQVDMLYLRIGRKWFSGILYTINLGHGIHIDVDTENRFRGVEIFDASLHFKTDELRSIQGGASWMTVRAAIAYVARDGDEITATRIRRLIKDGVITAKRDGRQYLIAMHTLYTYLANRPDAPVVARGNGIG